MDANSKDREATIVIGAGAAGLGAAQELHRRGVEPLILERARQIGTSWLNRYEGLRLNTVRGLSGLAGQPIPRHAGRWVTREDFAAYLRRHGEEHRVELGVEVEQIAPGAGEWLLETGEGTRRASSVVVATGYDREPRLPDWPGRDGFGGELLHSSAYRSPARYSGRDVLVVGPGNSGSEIATRLATAGAARVRLSVRTPVNLVPSTIFGVPATWFARVNETAPRRLVDASSRLMQRLAFGDLSRHGMGRAPLGVASELRERGLGPVLDRGFVAALKRGELEIVGAVAGFDGPRVTLSDGQAITPEVVIAATGHRPGLEPLVGHLGVLDDRGLPLVRDGGGEAPSAPGLYFNGYWLPLSGQLPGMRRSSRRIAEAISSGGSS